MRGISVFAFLVTVAASPASDNAAAEKISLRSLDRNPDRYLGRIVSIDGLLAKGMAISGNLATLTIRTESREKPTDLAFVAPLSLADPLRDALKASATRVRIIGTVMAPAGVNAPYNVEVEEIGLLAEDGAVTATFKPAAIPAAPPVEKAAAAPIVPAAAAVEQKIEISDDELPMGTILGVTIAIVLGCLLLGFVLFRRKAPPPPAPVRSVSERLERRKR